MPKKGTLPFPFKNLDVVGSTHSDLDVMQERKIDDYWNVDSCGPLSDSWRGKDTCGPGGRLTKIQTTTRLDHVWPEVWTKIGKAAQNREKHKEYSAIIKHARKKKPGSETNSSLAS